MNNVISFKAKKDNKKKEEKVVKSELEVKYAHQVAHMYQTCDKQELIEEFEKDKDKILSIFKLQEEMTQSIYDFIGKDVSEENVILVVKTMIAMCAKIRENSGNAYGDVFTKKFDYIILKEFESLFKTYSQWEIKHLNIPFHGQ